MTDSRRNRAYNSPRLPVPQPTAPLPDERELTGEVLRIVFSNAENGYGVVRLRRHPLGEEVTLAGNLGGVMEGMVISAAGHWEDTPSHGRQFYVEQATATLPTSAAGIEKYLASGLFEGINRKFAAAIVAKFGEQTLDILNHNPRRLTEVRGIGKKKLAALIDGWSHSSGDREAYIFLEGLGISRAYAKRIIDKYTALGAPEVVRRNPYILAADIDGIGFQSADRIAAALGIARNAQQRLAAGIAFALLQASFDGHTCLDHPRLISNAAELLKVSREEAEAGLATALAEGAVIADPLDGLSPCGQCGYYTPNLLRAEQELAETLELLLKIQLVQFEERRGAEEGLGTTAASPLSASRLDEEQELARNRALSCPISIITGGPGVGKTTVIAQIVRDALSRHWSVKLAAPTGRAAKRLSESSGQQATTIHRLLQFDPIDGHFFYNQDEPLKCDFLVIDEISMLDVFLARDLFAAIAPGTRVVLVGDKDQLPSVGPGAVLHDLIACGRIPVTELVHIYRQKDGSRIITSAHQVNAGKIPDLLNPPRGIKGDFYFYELDEPQNAAEYIRKLVTQFIPQFFGFNPQEDIQVLSPMRRGECGTVALNAAIQSALNPAGNDKPELAVGGTAPRIFRLGDRVMQTKNNYKKGVFNGEMGRIIAVSPAAKTFKVSFDLGIVDYSLKESEELLHAYAITIHKSQGSEFPVVVMPLLTQHFVMLQKNLLYTGMTRAKKLFILVGAQRAISVAVNNNAPMARMSGLYRRLTQKQKETL